MREYNICLGITVFFKNEFFGDSHKKLLRRTMKHGHHICSSKSLGTPNCTNEVLKFSLLVHLYAVHQHLRNALKIRDDENDGPSRCDY